MGGARSRFLSVASLAALALGISVTLLGFRDVNTGRGTYDFLVWNIFLASIPYALAVLIRAGHRRRAPWFFLVVAGGAWLLFLPNAFYIVTDFVHLGDIGGMPVWFDAAMIGSFACTGLLFGFASLDIMQSLACRWGVPTRLLTLGALVLSSVGIYLGRVHQFNSWDVIVRPGHLATGMLAAVADPASHFRALAATAELGAVLVLSYAAVHWLAVRRWSRDLSAPPTGTASLRRRGRAPRRPRRSPPGTSYRRAARPHEVLR